MSMRRGSRETEVKIPVGRAGNARRRLRTLGFRVAERRSFEQNEVYDMDDLRLKSRGCLLRLRGINGRTTLTFKQPAGASPHFKVRAELETELADPKPVRAAFAGLGLKLVFRYEKFRTVFRGRKSWWGGDVMLDETPIGNFLELEGSRRWIRRVARALGVPEKNFLTENYRQLHTRWCHRRGRSGTHMLFRR